MNNDIPAEAPIELPTEAPTGLVYRLTIGQYHYIGSTQRTLEIRLKQHFKTYTGGQKQRKLYGKIQELGGWDQLHSEVVEDNIPLDSLRAREAFHTNPRDPFCLNSVRPVRPDLPPIQRTNKTKPAQLERCKSYYEANKDELRRKRKERWQRDKQDPEKLARIRQQNADSQARYIAKLKSQTQS